MNKRYQYYALIIIVGYTSLLGYWMLFGFGRTTQIDYMYNLRPFATIGHYLQMYDFSSGVWVINIIGNIGVFAPLGILLPIALRGNALRSLMTFYFALLCLETVQLLWRRGSFDVDDLILNGIGYGIGFGIYKAAQSWRKENFQQQRSIE